MPKSFQSGSKRFPSGARLYSGLLLLCLLTALFFLIYPVYVIRPFRHQGARELGAALAILRARPFVEIGCILVASLGALMIWRSWVKPLPRGLALAGVALIAASIGLSRINIYEKMFHPVERPQFQPGSESKLDNREMVLAIQPAAIARAYPIRVISYHHIVNDVVGGIAVAATY